MGDGRSVSRGAQSAPDAVPEAAAPLKLPPSRVAGLHAVVLVSVHLRPSPEVPSVVVAYALLAVRMLSAFVCCWVVCLACHFELSLMSN